MPEQFESVYRVVGFGDEGRRMAIYDIPRDDSIWVNCIGYEGEILSELEDVQLGNLVDATVTDEGNENEYWNFLDFNIRDDTQLFYVKTDGYYPGPTDEFWERRDEGDISFSAAWRDDNGDAVYEIQVQSKEVPTESGETIEVYSNLQRGELLMEPFFEGSGTEYLDEGARHIIIVNADGKDYLTYYIFPDMGSDFRDIWGALQDYV